MPAEITEEKSQIMHKMTKNNKQNQLQHSKGFTGTVITNTQMGTTANKETLLGGLEGDSTSQVDMTKTAESGMLRGMADEFGKGHLKQQ